MSKPLLKFNCRFQYKNRFQLDAEFSLSSGISAMIGPSGSGKSTCLALISGVLKPTVGHIRLGEEVLVDVATKRWIPPHRRRVGVVFQEHLLFPHRTVAANLQYGMKRNVVRTICPASVVEVLELGNLLKRYPAQLSGGQQRRVALGRALLSEPRMLLLDEPLSGLDEPLRVRVLSYLRQVHFQWQIPMLLISHDQDAVQLLAEHTVVLEGGLVRRQYAASEDGRCEVEPVPPTLLVRNLDRISRHGLPMH